MPVRLRSPRIVWAWCSLDCGSPETTILPSLAARAFRRLRLIEVAVDSSVNLGLVEKLDRYWRNRPCSNLNPQPGSTLLSTEPKIASVVLCPWHYAIPTVDSSNRFQKLVSLTARPTLWRLAQQLRQIRQKRARIGATMRLLTVFWADLRSSSLHMPTLPTIKCNLNVPKSFILQTLRADPRASRPSICCADWS